MTVGSIGLAEQAMEELLPWHVTGRLDDAASRTLDEQLKRDPQFLALYRHMRDEAGETVRANEALGAPSPQVMERLFAAIDAEPSRAGSGRFMAALSSFFAGLSPRTLICSTAVAALAFIVQGGVIGSLLLNGPISERQGQGAAPAVATAPMAPAPVSVPAPTAPITRSMGAEAPIDNGVRVQIRFSADARMADIAQFMTANAASIVAGPRGGTFTVRFGRAAMSKDEVVVLVKSLEREPIVESIAIAQ